MPQPRARTRPLPRDDQDPAGLIARYRVPVTPEHTHLLGSGRAELRVTLHHDPPAVQLEIHAVARDQWRTAGVVTFYPEPED